MSQQLNHIVFTPSGTPLNLAPVVAPGGLRFLYSQGTFPLPAVDGSNTALLVSNTGHETAYFQLGTSSAGLTAGTRVRNSIILRGGEQVLLTSGNQGTQTFVNVVYENPGTGMTFQRGSVASIAAFQSSDDAVFVNPM